MNRQVQRVMSGLLAVLCVAHGVSLSAEAPSPQGATPREGSPQGGSTGRAGPEDTCIVMDDEERAPYRPDPDDLEKASIFLQRAGHFHPSAVSARWLDLQSKVVRVVWTGRSRVTQAGPDVFRVTLFGPDGSGIPALFPREGLIFVRGARARHIWRTANTPRGFVRAVLYASARTRDYVLVAPAAYAVVAEARVVDLRGREAPGPILRLLGVAVSPPTRYSW